jgi:hypothetical protein
LVAPLLPAVLKPLLALKHKARKRLTLAKHLTVPVKALMAGLLMSNHGPQKGLTSHGAQGFPQG